MPRMDNLLVIELDRRHIGCLVKIVTENLSIVGRLERIDHHDDAAWDLDGTPLRRDLMTELRISGWSAEVNPQQVITVEEKPEPLGQAQRNMDTLRRIAQAIEDREGRDYAPNTVRAAQGLPPAGGDVVPGVVVHADDDGNVPAFTVPDAPQVAYSGTVGPGSGCGESEHGAWHCKPGACSRPAECPLNVLDPYVKWEPDND